MRESKTGRRGSLQGGFTLVELLVVIGIIALLISILLPALGKAREQAKTVKCAANLRSAVQALHIYTSENKGWLPGPHTSGAIWKSGVDSIGPLEGSSDETPLQNMDWVSPTFGKSFKWPENDYSRLRTIYNVQLNCPSNSMMFESLDLNNEALPYTMADLAYSSYSAVIQFHAFEAHETAAYREPPIVIDMYAPANGGLKPPTGYAPMLSKIGQAAAKVYLVEGSRYIPLVNEGTFNASATKTSFNAARYQKVGGNFMIGGPFQPWPNTPYQLYEGSAINYTSKKLSPVAANFAWRHTGKMNIAFFDGHVELRAPADSIRVELYTPKGTTIIDAANTYDPNDKSGQIVN